MGFYYFSVCHVCKKPGTDLKKCGKCQVLHYCSRKHQVQDWAQHKDYCKVITESRKYLTFTPVAGNEGFCFNTFKTEQAIHWRLELGRDLEIFEHEMWMFPKVCRICFSSDVTTVCQNCWSAAYCSKHENSDIENHGKFCQALKLCLEIHQALEKMTCNPWNDMRFDFNATIPALPATIEDVVKMVDDINDLNFADKPIELALSTEYFCTPVNILYALEKSKFLDKRKGKRTKIVVHVASSELGTPTDWYQMMEFFSHWVPNLKTLNFFITSEENAEERLWFKLDCDHCREKHFTGCVQFLKGKYLDFIEDLPRPDVILMVNTDLPEVETSEWSKTFPKILKFKTAPIVLAGETKAELENEIAKFPERSIRFYLKPELNKYGSKRPVRNSDVLGEPAVFRTRFIAMVAKK